MKIEDIKVLLRDAGDATRREILATLRRDYGLAIHPLETRWQTTAEAILEAIDQASDLTQRGVRGVLAESIFRTVVAPTMEPAWHLTPIEGDPPFDALLRDSRGEVRVQVKLQRQERQSPLLAKIEYRKLDGKPTRGKNAQLRDDVYVVETQRTRTGKKKANGSPEAEETEVLTRPYGVDEFDVLAVCLQPLTRNWTDFIYCATRNLIVKPGATHLLETLQPVYIDGSKGWSREFSAAVSAFRGDVS